MIISHTGMCVGVVLSISMVITGSLAETPQTPLIVLGIVCGFLMISYLLAVMRSSVAMSRRWEKCLREQLSGPALAHKAIAIGLCASQHDFDFFLRSKHDVRGIFAGVRVTQHSVTTVLSGLASAMVVTIGYGIRSLL